jgi:hypothetical protein
MLSVSELFVAAHMHTFDGERTANEQIAVLE